MSPAQVRTRRANRPAADHFAEVLVYAGILHATAETLELLHDFFTITNEALRTHLAASSSLDAPDEDTGDPGMKANLLVQELTEAADLPHALAGDGGG